MGIDQIIIGNYYSYLNQKFAKISREVLVLDDGTNVLQKNLQLLKIKLFVFSIFDENFFKRKIIKKMISSFLKINFLTKVIQRMY